MHSFVKTFLYDSKKKEENGQDAQLKWALAKGIFQGHFNQNFLPYIQRLLKRLTMNPKAMTLSFCIFENLQHKMPIPIDTISSEASPRNLSGGPNF